MDDNADVMTLINIYTRMKNNNMNSLLLECYKLAKEIITHYKHFIIFYIAADCCFQLFMKEMNIIHLEKCFKYLQNISAENMNNEIIHLFKQAYTNLLIVSTDMNKNIEILQSIQILNIHTISDFFLQYLIGYSYHNLGVYVKAVEHYMLALAFMQPNDNEFKFKVCFLLGDVYYFMNNFDESYDYFTKCHKIRANDPNVHKYLGSIFKKKEEYDKALDHFEKGIRYIQFNCMSDSKTLMAELFANIGDIQDSIHNIKASIQYYDKAASLGSPGAPRYYSNKLFNMHYIDHENIPLLEHHKRINQIIGNVVQKYGDYRVKDITKERLRIGFVSSEFLHDGKWGPVCFFMNTIFNHINYDRFDVICYSLKNVDEMRSKYYCISWKHIEKLSAIELKELIVQDKIDILIDLDGHTSDNKLDTFALKAAPIQITYCGYPNTTGLINMDYRITDKYCDSDGISVGVGGIVRESTQKYYTEKLVFMDKCFLSFAPNIKELPEMESPIATNDFLTIGSFNKIRKINANVIKVWTQILKRCPSIMLVIKTSSFTSQEKQNKFLELWDDDVRKQIKTLYSTKTYEEHLNTFNNVDICLDTFPYSGTTTTCESLLMGVPVITLFDSDKQYHVQNVSSSILVNSELSEWLCYSEEEYIEKICYYASNLEEMRNLKKVVRDKFKRNMYDNKEFVAEFEEKLVKLYEGHIY